VVTSGLSLARAHQQSPNSAVQSQRKSRRHGAWGIRVSRPPKILDYSEAAHRRAQR